MAKLTIEREINNKNMYIVMKGIERIECIHEPKLESISDTLDMTQPVEINETTIHIIQKGKIGNESILYGICEQCGKFYFTYDVTI
jgi:hypothetical protein